MYKTFTEIKAALTKGETVQSILQAYIENIKKRESLNAFVEVFETSAMEQAKAVDEKLKNGTAGRLAGMVIGIKDNICYKGHKVSAASKMLENFESIFSATAVERLLAEDAVIVGRLNCDEFAMGSANRNTIYGATKNALNEEYITGGSSGGSATAVAGNLCTVALGSDTGGSIRQPASYTGTVGIKPTYGRVSRYGLIAYASSFDQIGPIANDVKDVALVLEVMAGKDEYDSTASSNEVPSYEPSVFDEKLKIAYIKETIENESLDSEIKERLLTVMEELKGKGHELVPVSLSSIHQIIPTYYLLTAAEASSNLSRFDGIHFGYRSENAKDVEETYVNSRSEGFGAEVKRRIMAGTMILSKDNYDSFYHKAQKVRRLIHDGVNAILDEYDFILLPTAPTTALRLDEENDPIKAYAQDIFTVLANLSGNPAISIPVGTHSNGMPFGLQIMAKHFAEKELFDFSAYVMEL